MVLGAESVAVILDDTEYVSAFLDEHAWHKFMILFQSLLLVMSLLLKACPVMLQSLSFSGQR
jgi:hypothetical protein